MDSPEEEVMIVGVVLQTEVVTSFPVKEAYQMEGEELREVEGHQGDACHHEEGYHVEEVTSLLDDDNLVVGQVGETLEEFRD